MREFRVEDNPAYIGGLARARQQREACFALAVYNAFNQGQALTNLREVAKSLLGLMVKYHNQPALVAGIDDARVDRLWAKSGVQKNLRGIFDLQHRCQTLDASDCADVVRLAGTWVEKGGLKVLSEVPNRPAQNLLGDDLRQAYRAGDARTTATRENTRDLPGRPAIQPPSETWGSAARPARLKGNFPIEGHIQRYMPVMTHAVPGTAALARAAKTGMTGARAGDTSVVRAIDRLFDLTVGVEISGTTADCTFDLELVNNLAIQNIPDQQMKASAAAMLHVAYYLMPVGTIVANMHHTLLEVALTLSFDGLMDYHVGYFKSLVPKGLVNWPQELADIKTVMELSDLNMRVQNLHCFCYYENCVKQGIFQLDDYAEIVRWGASRQSSATELHRWARANHFPSREAVKGLLRQGGLLVPD